MLRFVLQILRNQMYIMGALRVLLSEDKPWYHNRTERDDLTNGIRDSNELMNLGD